MVLSQDKQVFVLKGSISKGINFVNDLLLIECFSHLPPLAVQDTNPTDYHWIFTKQYETEESALLNAHLPPLAVQDTNPTDNQWIFTKQNKTEELVKQQQKFPDTYFNTC